MLERRVVVDNPRQDILDAVLALGLVCGGLKGVCNNLQCASKVNLGFIDEESVHQLAGSSLHFTNFLGVQQQLLQRLRHVLLPLLLNRVCMEHQG